MTLRIYFVGGQTLAVAESGIRNSIWASMANIAQEDSVLMVATSATVRVLKTGAVTEGYQW